jgi:hypothetical protein
MLKRPATLCACPLFAAVFAVDVARLFELRFDQGDLYPPYSTLRTDPLGTSVLYESLDRVTGVTSQRYYEATFKNDDGRAHSLFILGTQPYSLDSISRSEFDTLQRFVYNGGRVVIAYYPEIGEPRSSLFEDTNEMDNPSPPGKRPRHSHIKPKPDADENNSDTNAASNEDDTLNTNNINDTNAYPLIKSRRGRDARRHIKPNDQQDQDDEDDLKEEMKQYADLSQEWGFQLKYKDLDTNDDGQIEFPNALRMSPSPDLPVSLAIHTSLYFTDLTNGWTTIYQRHTKAPVVVERKFGAGSVVLVADSYPFSNEAMFKERSAPLLAWLLGSGRDAIFDEAHLGIVEQPGMATLVRRYQLHGLVFSLLVVAGLFIWKNSFSLVPPHTDTHAEAGPLVIGRDSASGFVNLMRRSIAPADIINACFTEWKKSSARSATLSPAQLRELEQLIQQQNALEPRLRKPIENYRLISQILQRQKRTQIYEPKSRTT